MWWRMRFRFTRLVRVRRATRKEVIWGLPCRLLKHTAARLHRCAKSYDLLYCSADPHNIQRTMVPHDKKLKHIIRLGWQLKRDQTSGLMRTADWWSNMYLWISAYVCNMTMGLILAACDCIFV
ncbi:hypothetical protein Plhal304r1_c016g0058661 [Plasmopara halstedii]